MLATLPTANFSANDFIVEFTNCYDKYQGATFTRLTDTTGTLTYTGTAADTGVVTDTVIRMSYLVGANIIEFALKATATPVGNNGTIPVTINVIGTIVPTTRTVSWYKVSGATARSQTLFLQNTGLGVAVQITIRPKTNGVATVTFGEQIRGLLPPFNLLSTELRNTITYIYNGAQYNLIVYRGQKYLNPNPTLTQSAINILTPTNQYYSAFEEQLNVTLRVFTSSNTIQTQALSNFDLGFNASNSFGGNMQFFLYSRAVCNRASIYLSGRYEMLDRIDVSTVVLAFIDGYGLHQYARFNGNNVGRYNVEAGTLKKDVTSLVAPANNGEIYEAIDLTLESDAGSSAAAYKVTADEVQRVIGGLMASPFIWLVAVVGGSEYFIPVRVERSSVKFIGSLQDSQPKATLTIILNQPLGIAQP
jgi:hypothetical protein